MAASNRPSDRAALIAALYVETDAALALANSPSRLDRPITRVEDDPEEPRERKPDVYDQEYTPSAEAAHSAAVGTAMRLALSEPPPPTPPAPTRWPRFFGWVQLQGCAHFFVDGDYPQCTFRMPCDTQEQAHAVVAKIGELTHPGLKLPCLGRC
jgi:hypothetical protein